MSPAGLGTKNCCTGENQEQFTGLGTIVTRGLRLVDAEAPF
jgi:hypothetical protein